MTLAHPPVFFIFLALYLCGMVATAPTGRECSFVCPDAMPPFLLAPSEADRDNILRCVYERRNPEDKERRSEDSQMACAYSMTDGTFHQREIRGVAVSEIGECPDKLDCNEVDDD